MYIFVNIITFIDNNMEWNKNYCIIYIISVHNNNFEKKVVYINKMAIFEKYIEKKSIIMQKFVFALL
jgi:hypothetical protein